jgi:nicotinate-nucleotide pyrophosphorylase
MYPHAQNNHRSGNDHAKSILVKDNHVNMFRAVSSLTLRFTGESEM